MTQILLRYRSRKYNFYFRCVYCEYENKRDYFSLNISKDLLRARYGSWDRIMGKYYHIYKCKSCDKRWGTEKGDGTQPKQCETCLQFCDPVESRENRRNLFKCGGCGSEFTSQQIWPTTCKKCGTKVFCAKWDTKSKYGPKKVAQPPINEAKAKHWQRMMEERERSQQQEHQKFSSHQNLSFVGQASHDFESSEEDRHVLSGPENGARSCRGSAQTAEKKQADADKSFAVGNAFFVEGEYALAIEKYTEAIDMSPPQMEAFYKNRSRANMKLDKFEEAEQDMRKSLQGATKVEAKASKPIGHGDAKTPLQTSKTCKTSKGLNVRVIEALYDNDFEPVDLREIVGSGAENKSLMELVAKEMPSALKQSVAFKFHRQTGLFSVNKLEDICQRDGYKFSVCRGECKMWHVCKKWILGNCEHKDQCERHHDFFNELNSSLLEKNNLHGIDPKILRALFLSQHRPYCMRPRLCFSYQDSKRHNEKACNFLHLCINFRNSCKCSAFSHDVLNEHNQRVLKYCNVSMDGHCSKEEMARRLALWDPMIRPRKDVTLTNKARQKIAAAPPVKQSVKPAAKHPKISVVPPLKRESPESTTSQKKTENQCINTHLEKKMASASLKEETDVSSQVPVAAAEANRQAKVKTTKSAPSLMVSVADTSEDLVGHKNSVNDAKELTKPINDTAVDSETIGAASVSKWRPIWQYNPSKRGWKNFSEERQAELETAVCDVETEVQAVSIEGTEVAVNMDHVSMDEYTESGSVEIRRMFARDKWKWYLGSRSDNKWAEITGEHGTDVQGQIERAFKNYKSTDSERRIRMRISNGQVLVDFQEWIATAPAEGLYLDLRRRPDPS